MIDQQLKNDYKEMVKSLAKPGDKIYSMLSPNDCHLIHMLFGMAGELLEIELAISNYEANFELLGEEKAIEEYDKNMLEELGDLQFYFVGFAAGLSVKFGIVIDFLSIELNYSKETSFIKDFEEFFDMMKKILIIGKQFDIETIKKVTENAYTSLGGVYTRTGVDYKQSLVANLNKLLKGKNARYATGNYSDEQTIARADKNAE